MRQDGTYNYNMPMTLETHFQNLAQIFPSVKELHSLWILLRKQIEEKLVYSTGVFVNYSLHDKTHCFSVIQSIERFLGEDRICQLSATDTFMLLVCIYSHDYGMAQTFNKIYDILGSAMFKEFLEEQEKEDLMEKEDAWAIHNILNYLNEEKTKIPLNDLYFSIMLVVQLYLRPLHWKGVIDIRNDYKILFQSRLKERFINGSEGIVEICMSHGQSREILFKLPYCSDGMFGDDYHPRFIASMLRLGDLLDMDNGRFPVWFTSEIAHNKNLIPQLSILHFRKHEAISHFLITPKKIEITAQIYSSVLEPDNSDNIRKKDFLREKALKESYETASLISEWTEQLSDECQELVLKWDEIVQPDFGRPPACPKVNIYVDDEKYMSQNRTFQMKMPQEQIMKLLEGTSIYKDKFVGIREMIQNAIDASLLQLWSDLLGNRYSNLGLTKDKVSKDFDLFDLINENQAVIFKNYDIKVEVIEDKVGGQVLVVVKDKGIGIAKEDIPYIATIGSSKEKNIRMRRLTNKMPAWLRPSGVFGIGLQSVFQLTDCIEFYTRQHNEPEHLVSLYSYGKSKGRVETKVVSEKGNELFYDNTIPGTNVKISVNPDKILTNKEHKKINLQFYDPEFHVDDELHMIFVQVSKACENIIRESEYDYFNIFFESMIFEEDGSRKKGGTGSRCRRNSFMYPNNMSLWRKFGKNLMSFRRRSQKESYFYYRNQAFFWDKENFRCYYLTLRACQIKEEDSRYQVILPEKVQSLYNISYKFNKISNTEAIYAQQNSLGRLHAGFLKLDVMILDGHPMNYMNIDRDRLKEEAIKEDELITVYDQMVRNWCELLCQEKKSESTRWLNEIVKAIKCAGQGSSSAIVGTVISMILLFYQNVPEKLFRQFMERYFATIDFNDFVLDGNEGLSVSKLWDSRNLFRTCSTCLKDKKENSGILDIEMENILRLPHRMIRVEKIQKEEGDLCYFLRLQSADPSIKTIDMDEETRLHDYMSAFGPDTDKDIGIRVDNIQNKVFKPDKRYELLVVPCFPSSFHKGRNMEAELDYCLNGYILSPFDIVSIPKLVDIIKLDKNSASEVEEIKLKELVKTVMGGKQLRNCISYIMLKKFSECKDKGTKQEEIRKEYKRFLEYFCRLIIKNREKF